MGSEQDLQTIKAPHTMHEEAAASIRTHTNQAFLRLTSASSPTDVSYLQDDIVRYGGDLKELETEHKVTLCDKEVAYEEQRKYVLEKLCLDLVTTLGLPLVESAVQALSNRESSERRSFRTLQGPTPTDSSQGGRTWSNLRWQCGRSSPGWGSYHQRKLLL